MLKKIFALTFGFLSIITIFAQTESSKKSPTTFSGSLDAYYRYNFSNPTGGTNNFTSFTNSQNSFELGMATFRVDHSIGKIAATVDIGFGRRAQEFSYNDVGTTLTAVKQAYFSYAPSDKLKFTIGKWATHVGYELVDATGNRNYSMSYGFSYGPFFHTGIKADISLGGKTALMVGVANPTDYAYTTSPKKVVIVQLSTASKNDKFKAFLNYQGGTDFSQFDLVLTRTLSSKFSLSYDGTIANYNFKPSNSSWKDHALYLNFDPTDKFGLTLRGEYFDDRSVSPLIPTANNIFATTLSANIKLDHITLIPELRFDNAKGNIFSKGLTGTAINNTSTFLIAAVYKF